MTSTILRLISHRAVQALKLSAEQRCQSVCLSLREMSEGASCRERAVRLWTAGLSGCGNRAVKSRLSGCRAVKSGLSKAGCRAVEIGLSKAGCRAVGLSKVGSIHLTRSLCSR